MADRFDCGECPTVLGCFGKCGKTIQREHEEAERLGQQGLDLRSPVGSIGEQLRHLLVQAKRDGVVVEVHLVPLQPLAMGNYAMVGTVRPAREKANG